MRRGTAMQAPFLLRRPARGANRLAPGPGAEISRGHAIWFRRHEVDASMMPQNAQATLSLRAAGALSAEGRGMASAADALFTNNATMARRRFSRLQSRA